MSRHCVCTVGSKVLYEAAVVAAEVFSITANRVRDGGCLCVRVRRCAHKTSLFRCPLMYKIEQP